MAQTIEILQCWSVSTQLLQSLSEFIIDDRVECIRLSLTRRNFPYARFVHNERVQAIADAVQCQTVWMSVDGILIETDFYVLLTLHVRFFIAEYSSIQLQYDSNSISSQ